MTKADSEGTPGNSVGIPPLARYFANVAVSIYFLLALVLGIAGLLTALVGLVQLNFPLALGGFVMAGFWCLLAFMSYRSLRRGRQDNDSLA